MVLNGGKENEIYYKISSKVPCDSHGDETLIKKSFFFFTNFHYHLIPPLPMVVHWNGFYEKNKMIEVGQAWPSR